MYSLWAASIQYASLIPTQTLPTLTQVTSASNVSERPVCLCPAKERNMEFLAEAARDNVAD